MRSFQQRWTDGIEMFLNTHQNMHTAGATGGRNRAIKERRRRDMRALNALKLRFAFQETTFIYGTQGPHSSPKNPGSTPIIRTLNNIYKTNTGVDPAASDENAALVIQNFMRFARRKKTTFDPGPRVKEYIRSGCQMMDMYFGMQGKNSNILWQHRNNIIAEFIHYVMDYHRADGNTRPLDFDPAVPGWQTYQDHFNTNAFGWTGNTYGQGQSATKEISKIIRTGIETFGGKLVFEGQQVFGDNIFSPNGWVGDTDAEARDLFRLFAPTANAAEVPFGQGRLEFQWGGTPTIPTRAHFLSNWRFAGAQSHTKDNQKSTDDSEPIYAFLGRAMQTGRRDEFLEIWDNFENLPIAMRGANNVVSMMRGIERIAANV